MVLILRRIHVVPESATVGGSSNRRNMRAPATLFIHRDGSTRENDDFALQLVFEKESDAQPFASDGPEKLPTVLVMCA